MSLTYFIRHIWYQAACSSKDDLAPKSVAQMRAAARTTLNATTDVSGRATSGCA